MKPIAQSLFELASVSLLASFIVGCSTPNPQPNLRGNAKSDTSLFTNLSQATASTTRSLAQLVSPEKVVHVPEWDWATVIPVETPRSEMAPANLDAAALRFLAPSVNLTPTRLVSWHGNAESFRVVSVEGQPVRNCSDLFRATTSCSQKTAIQIDVIDAMAPHGSAELGVKISPEKIVALGRVIAPQQPVMRIVDEGVASVVYREGGVVSTLKARVERSRGLLHMVVSVANCWGEDRLLPVEIQANCNGRPLRVLSVAETMEALYCDAISESLTSTNRSSFAVVSESDDYLAPISYPRIEREMSDKYGKSKDQPVSAFASIPGQAYPGPAALADARALSGFLMQRQLCRPGDPEHTGWIVFTGGDLKDGGDVEVSIDLGQGLRHFRFHVPPS